jgi:hypothetical protein
VKEYKYNRELFVSQRNVLHIALEQFQELTDPFILVKLFKEMIREYKDFNLSLMLFVFGLT